MRLVMMGTGTFAEPTFEAILKTFPGEVVGLVTQPDRDVGRRSGSSRQTGVGMGTIAKAHSIPVLQPESINSDEGIALLAALEPDLCVVAAYGQIFKANVLSVPKLGFINVHASLLPKYRGAAPVAHAILNRERETGVTIFRITTGVDTGEILAAESLEIGANETTGELEGRLATVGAKLAVDVVDRLKQGPVQGKKQDASLATRAPKITKEMGLIDWNQHQWQTCHHVRAMQPWPTAYSFLHRTGHNSLRVTIRKVRQFCVDVGPGDYPPPGTINREASGSKGNVLIVYGLGGSYTEIEELQIAGKKPMTAAEFLRGYPLPEGSRFGPERLS